MNRSLAKQDDAIRTKIELNKELSRSIKTLKTTSNWVLLLKKVALNTIISSIHK